MVKYIASIDLDDTFLRLDKSISPSSKQFVKEFVNKGNHFIINTGRPHQGAVQYLKELGIHEPMVVNNGSAIITYDDNYQAVVDATTFSMDKELIKSLLSKVHPFLQTELITCLNDDYSYDFEKCPWWVIHKGSNVQFHQGDVSQILNQDPIKVELWVYQTYKEQFEEILNSELFQNKFEILKWEGREDVISYELSSKGVNKGYAIEFLAKKWHINKKNIFSFGDQLNDIPMIEKANYGVAMINSVDKVKRHAKYVSTYDYNNDGVIEFIKSVIKE